LTIIHGDFMKVDPPYFDICVANVPYNISSGIVFKLLARPSFRAAVIMFQREFAMRLVAKAGDPLYCRLSANCQLLSRVNHLLKVGKNCFRPPPKVESSVVRIEPRPGPPPVAFPEWDGLTRLAFGRKNKTLGGIFRQKKVLSLLEDNYNTYQALRKAQGAGAGAGGGETVLDLSQHLAKLAAETEGNDGREGEDDDAMMMDDDAEDGYKGPGKAMSGKDRKHASAEFKDMIMRILDESGYSEKRGVKMDQDDFFRLIAHFNKQGVHFS